MKKLLIASLMLLLLPAAGYSQKTKLVDDFNDLNLMDNFGGEWKPEDDASQGGDSSAVVNVVGGRAGSKGALRLDYVLGSRFAYRYSTVALIYPGMRDWSEYTGIRFWVRGDGHKMRLEIGTDSVKDYDYHAYRSDKTPTEWTEYVVPFTNLTQGAWGQPVKFNPALVHRLYLVASSGVDGEKGFIELDDFTLEK